MTADEMANFHKHMMGWCNQKAETRKPGMVDPPWAWEMLAEQHHEAFKYWCAQVPR